MLRIATCALLSLVVSAQTSSPQMAKRDAEAPTRTPQKVIGNIVDSESSPVASAVVALVPMGARAGLISVEESRSDRAGRFVLKGAPGRYGLTITAPGFFPHFRNLELKDGEADTSSDFRLERGGFLVRGRLLPAAGFTLEKVRLGFSKESQDDGDQFFGMIENGRFEITLAPGSYRAVAEAEGQTGSQRFEVTAGMPDLQIQLVSEPRPAEGETRRWIKTHAIPLLGVRAGQGFEDMKSLKRVVGAATVVGLGEATHGTREFFQLKHRMLEFLVSELGFSVFAMEANLPEAHFVNTYLQTGEGDPAKALAGLYFWTWNTEEVLDMIRWMRTYNLDPTHTKKIQFYGVDMQTETVALEQASSWLGVVAPVEVPTLDGLKKRMAKLPSPNGGTQTTESRSAWAVISRETEELIGRLKTSGGDAKEFDRQRQNLRVIAQFAAMGADPGWGNEPRDAAMAANLRWVQERENGAKIVLWAHNGHISARPHSLGGANPLGWHLKQALGQSYLPIGFAFQDGSFRAKSSTSKEPVLMEFEVKSELVGTLDTALASAGIPYLALDLRARPTSGEVKRWLESPQGTWFVGSTFDPQRSVNWITKLPITEAVDVLLFVAHTTPTRRVVLQK